MWFPRCSNQIRTNIKHLLKYLLISHCRSGEMTKINFEFLLWAQPKWKKTEKKKKLFHGGADYSLEKQCTYVWRLVNVEVLVVHHSANHVYKNSPRTINFKLLEIIRTVSTFISDWRRQPIYHSNARFGMFGMRNWLSDSWMWSLSKLSKLAAIMHVRHA